MPQVEVTVKKNTIEVSKSVGAVRSVAGKVGEVTLGVDDIEGLQDAINVAGNDRHYPHDQQISSDTWTIPHGLGKYPSITVIDSAGDEVEGDVSYPSLNVAIVRFNGAFSGKAYAN